MSSFENLSSPGTLPFVDSLPQLPQGVRRIPPLLASRQRGWIQGLPSYVSVPTEQVPTVLAVGGGKGGVGKSLLSANLGVRLSRLGYKVLVVDLDIGGANLHTYFGLSTTSVSLADFMLRGSRNFSDVMLSTAVPDVMFVAGSREDSWGTDGNVERAALARLWTAILMARVDHQFDFVLLDLGAGTHRHTIDLFCGAHLGIVTVLPEPTSIENAYLFLKTALWRLIDHVGARENNAEAAADIKAMLTASDTQGFQVRGYADRLRSLAQRYPGLVSQVFSALHGRSVGIVVNQTRSQQDIDIGRSMELIGQRYFGLTTTALGWLNYDEAAWKSLRNRRLLSVDFPHSALTRRVTDLAVRALQTLGY